jgi:anti-sigma-K factor RskA
VSEDRFLELAPIAALGALDEPERVDFERHLPACASCRAELESHERVVSLIPLAWAAVGPSTEVRRRVVGRRSSTSAASWIPLAAAALTIVSAVLLLQMRSERNLAVEDAAAARAETARLTQQQSEIRRELALYQAGFTQARTIQALVVRSESRFTRLSGQGPQPQSQARVVWDPKSREAILVASGLHAAPAGKAYEVWVIARGAPVPAGVFQPDQSGLAVVQLRAVDEITSVKTFAVSVEPAEGVPAPTGPIVLAGSAGP